MIYSIKKISEIIEGEALKMPNPETIIRDILYDSRKLVSAGKCLFFAIASTKNDGHRYIPELYQNGIRNFVASDRNIETDEYPDANFILTNNPLASLQTLCGYHRQQFKIPVIGITGSNGKTIIKEWLCHLLSPDNNIVRSPKSYNSQIGVPVSVWQLETGHELAIFEAGISMPGEMKTLQAIINPDIGIFTNIGPAHDENFADIHQKVSEKLLLFYKAKTLIYCKDHQEIDHEIKRNEELIKVEKRSWGKDPANDLQILKIRKHNKLTLISGIYKTENIEIEIPFTDIASVENAIHCWLTMLLLGHNNETIKPRIKTLTPVAMRLELKEGINGCSLINDSYSSDISSLAIALEFLGQQQQNNKKTVILSDILQTGRPDDELYKEIAEILTNKGVDRVIGIGPVISKQVCRFKMKKFMYPSTEDFLNNFPLSNFYKENILLKGARIFEFEKISEALQQKTHATTLEINLDALVHNLNYYRSKLKPGTKIMAMVKAFSYGSGSYEIANILQFHHVDYLAVAYADEGVQLRNAGINLPVMVMNPEKESFDAIVKYNLEPEIYNFRILNALIETLKHNNNRNTFKIHIKLDTGMRRLGFEPEDTDNLIEVLKHNKEIKVRSIFSHLTSSENPDHDKFTIKQIELFRGMSDRIMGSLNYPVILHMLNSAGIRRFPDAQFDMVRLGISLYGISPYEDEQEKLQQTGSLKSTISQIKHIEEGETVGYNRQWKASSPSVIATIPVGYADGLNRKLGNGKGNVLIKNKKCPIIGNICMDMCMVDISGTDAKEGDEVIIFGKDNPVTEMAEALNTIPYEILTSIPQRVKRVYFRE